MLNPSALETLVEKRRKIMSKNEKFVKDNISTLLDIFYANNEMPGARTLEGIEGLKEAYLDSLRVKKDIYLLRTTAYGILSSETGDGFLDEYRRQLPILGIHTYALTSVNKDAIKHSRSGNDEATLYHRVWMPEEDYTAPVSIQAYGDKVAFISFGETQMATIITSPAIAEAVRQMIKIMMKYYKKNFKQDY